MSATVQKVSVIPYEGRFAIQDEDGEFFYNIRDEVRTFSVAGDATYFLKNACEQYPTLGYIVTLPSGKVRYLGTATSPEEEGKFGPHEWSKANLVTISDSTGMYDLYKCRYCSKTEKAFGLRGHVARSGICKRNPL